MTDINLPNYSAISKFTAALLIVLFGMTSGCAVKERHATVAPLHVDSYNTNYSGPKALIIVGDFNNSTTYMRGLFTDNIDRLGSQAKTVLKTHLQQTNRFDLMDRDYLDVYENEVQYSDVKQKIESAKYAIVGVVTEFGRRNSSDKQLFGLLGSGKQQKAYAKVLLNVVDVKTTRVVHSSQGAGEYKLTSRQAIGFGTKTGYDESLNGKVMDLAIREAINNLIVGIDQGKWSPI